MLISEKNIRNKYSKEEIRERFMLIDACMQL